MQVTVHFFGHYSDYSGGEPLTLSLPTGTDLQSLALRLAERDARFAGLARHCRFAVNEEYAEISCVLTEGCTVAVLPPMSGG